MRADHRSNFPRRLCIKSCVAWVAGLAALTCAPSFAKDKRTPATQGAQASVASPVGFFYFGQYRKLDPSVLRGAPVRTAIEWGEYEPSQGRFVFDHKNAAKIDQLLADGKQVLPSIRSRSPWAVEKVKKSRCASAPLDLDRKKPLKVGEIYSPTYAAFLTKIADAYRGKFDIVVIENEMNDPDDMWCASVDDYLRLFLTARSALQAADPKIRVADGGIQGVMLNWMVIADYLKQKDIAGAQAFYTGYSGEKLGADELRQRARQIMKKDIFRRSTALHESDLFDWVDVVNFHYYQKSDGIPAVVALLRKRAGDEKPILTNEMGIKERFSGDPNQAEREMIKKVTRMFAHGVAPVLWFAPNGEKDMNAGALIDGAGKLIPGSASAFELIAKQLGRNWQSTEDTSDATFVRQRFVFSHETVEVVWPRAEGAGSFTPGKDCDIFSFRNERLETAPTAETMPAMIVCKSS